VSGSGHMTLGEPAACLRCCITVGLTESCLDSFYCSEHRRVRPNNLQVSSLL
jgi:hypothetical protein